MIINPGKSSQFIAEDRQTLIKYKKLTLFDQIIIYSLFSDKTSSWKILVE